MLTDNAQNWLTQRKYFVNTDNLKKSFNLNRTNSYQATLPKSKRNLELSLNSIDNSNTILENKTENSSSQFKGPLDDLMLKVVGERWNPSFEDIKECDTVHNTCDRSEVCDSELHYTNCQLELKGLKESLSSYSISSLRQL